MSQASRQEALFAMRDVAWERIDQDADTYATAPHALAIYIQGTLFDMSIRQQHESQDQVERCKLAHANPGTVFLFPDEFAELRYRAAYHGAGLATEADANIPLAVMHQLSNNLENYRLHFEYEQTYMPWTYGFKPMALRKVLAHDFRIAAEDAADGSLYQLCQDTESTEEEYWYIPL